MRKVDPFLRPIASYRAVKALADAREGLFQKSDQVVCRGCPLLGSKLKLTVQCFQIITNRIHRGIVSQISPVVKSIAGDFQRICLVGFHTAQRISAVLLNEQRVYRTDIKTGFMQSFCDRLIIAPGVLHYDTGLPIKSLQLICERDQSYRVVSDIEWQPNDLAKGAKHCHRTLSA